MAFFWLVPLMGKQPLRLGAERLKCEPLAELMDFRQKLDSIHSWLLPLFKANLLLANEMAEVCGGNGEPNSLSMVVNGEIIFDQQPYQLSTCAENFLERLLTIEQSIQGYHIAETAYENMWSPIQHHWLQLIIKWLNLHHEIMIVREEEWQ